MTDWTAWQTFNWGMTNLKLEHDRLQTAACQTLGFTINNLRLEHDKLVNLLCTSLFYIHTWHQLTEAASWDEDGMLQSVPQSAGPLTQGRDVSITQKSKPANQTQSEAWKHNPEHSFTGWKLWCFEVCLAWQQMFGESSWSFLKLHVDLQSHIKHPLKGCIYFWKEEGRYGL